MSYAPRPPIQTHTLLLWLLLAVLGCAWWVLRLRFQAFSTDRLP